MNARQILIDNLSIIGDWAIQRIITELKDQGRIIDVNTTGYDQTGEESLEYTIEEVNGVFTLNIIGNDYLLAMDEDQPARSINWNPEDIIEFGKRIYPGLSDSAVLGRLRGLKKLQQRVGSPTPQSYNYTKNGRRTNWTEYALTSQQDKIEQLLNLFAYSQALVDEAFIEFSRNVA